MDGLQQNAPSNIRAEEVGAGTRRAAGKIGDIEALRGISIVFVLLNHLRGTLVTSPWPVWTHITEAYFSFWTGVDLFFVISGFVIARSLVPRLQAAKTARAFAAEGIVFWIRRAWRLLPSAWLWLGVILIGAAFFNSSGSFGLFHDNFEATISGMLGVANLRLGDLMFHAGYGVSAPYWSLSMEEQFYLCLPFAVYFARRRLVLVLAGALAFFAVLPNSPYAGVLRFQPILLGVLLAELSRHDLYRMIEPRFLARSMWLRACVLGLPLLILAALAPLKTHILPFGRFDAIAAVASILVFVASYNRNYSLADGRAKSVLMWLGSRSYAIYLIHLPAFCLARELLFRLIPDGRAFDGRHDRLLIAVGLTLTAVLAEVNFRSIETPLRERGARITSQMALRFAAGDTHTA